MHLTPKPGSRIVWDKTSLLPRTRRYSASESYECGTVLSLEDARQLRNIDGLNLYPIHMEPDYVWVLWDSDRQVLGISIDLIELLPSSELAYGADRERLDNS